MIHIRPIIRQILVDAEPVRALATGGIHGYELPPNERRPRVLLSKLGAGERARVIDGGDGSRHGPERAILQVACLAPTSREAAELSAACQEALDDFAGEVSVGGHAVRVDWIECEPDRDIPAEPQTAQERATAGVSFEAEALFSRVS